MDSTQNSRPRHLHSFRNQSHYCPLLKVLIVFEASGLMPPSQACLDRLEPNRGFDYSMTNSHAKMFPSTPAMKMRPLNRRRKSKGLHLLCCVTPNGRPAPCGLEDYLRPGSGQRPRNRPSMASSKRSAEHQQRWSRQDNESAFPQRCQEPLESCCIEYTGRAFAHHNLITRS
jgi:hypothetical protein